MTHFFVDTRIVDAWELDDLGIDLRELMERACTFSRTREPELAVPGEVAHLFKFPAAKLWRYKHHDRRSLWEKFGGVCYLCQKPVEYDEFQIEHVVPLCRGGEDVWSNLNVAHRACNARKGTSLLSELDWIVS